MGMNFPFMVAQYICQISVSSLHLFTSCCAVGKALQDIKTAQLQPVSAAAVTRGLLKTANSKARLWLY